MQAFADATAAEAAPPIHTNFDLEGQAEEVRAGRVRDGLCPHCGTQLYETVRKGVLRKKVTRPLSVAGQVVRGQCVRCQTGEDNSAAIALAAIAEPSTATTEAEASSNVIPAATATPLFGSSAIQLDARYNGQFNNYGERHGQGELIWSNGDKYKGES